MMKRFFLYRRRCLVSVFIAIATFHVSIGVAVAEPQREVTQLSPVEAIDMAPVVVDGITLFNLRGISSFPAKTRAAAVSDRIKVIARDPSVTVSDLRIVVAEDRSNILAGGQNIVSVFDVDAEAEQMNTRQVMAEIMQNRIATSIKRYRHERSSSYLLPQALKAAVALTLLAASILAMRWLFRWIDRVLERRLQARLKKLEAKSYRLLSAEELKSAWLGALGSLQLLIILVLIVVGVESALGLFPWTRWFAMETVTLLIRPLAHMWGGIVNALPGLAFIAILFFVARYVLRLGQLFFSGVAYGTIRPRGFEQDWAWPTYRLVRMMVIAFAIIIAYPYIPGSDSAAFKGVSLFAGLLMSLGATSIVANSLAGYMLIYRRAFRVGDRIKVGDVVGDVVEMRQQLTHLRTPKSEEVTIPSSVILNSNVINYSARARQGGIILHTTVGIGYETPWRQVEAMLIEAANRTEGLLPQPSPFVLQSSLGDFCVTYEINAYCDQPQQMPQIYTKLHRNILDIFNEYGVQIMTPNYVADAATPKVVPPEQWHLAPATPPVDTTPEAKEPGR